MHRPITSGLVQLGAFLLNGLSRPFGGHLMAPNVLYPNRQAAPARMYKRPSARYPNGSLRVGRRYTRNDMHGQQQRSHDPQWQAMNVHIRNHLFPDS